MSASPTPPQYNNIPTITGEDGELIKRGRIKDPQALISTYWTLHTADWQASRQRALYQSMIDGAPPYAPGKDRSEGISGRVNVNWGLAAQAQEEAEMPYNDILDALDVFGDIPTSFGDEKSQDTWGTVISEEITRMLKNWDDFHPLWQQNAHLFVAEGVSFAFHEDEQDWRYRIYGQQFLKFPRRIPANVNKIDIVTCKVDMLPHELYRKVENAKVAEDSYWNRNAVIEAIKDTCAQHTLPTNDPQEWEKAWKDNDINLGTTVSCVETVHGWVREVDGTVSQYISRMDGNGEFLYKCEGKHRAMSSVMFAYLYGVGSNGDFQSIRGLGQKLFSSSTGLNRLICKELDMAIHAATPYLQCDNEDAGQENAVRPMGPYMVVQSGFQFVEKMMPPFAQNLVPAIEQIKEIYRARAMPYSPVSANGTDNTQRTKYEWQMKTEQQGKLSSAGMNLFFAAWRRHFKEIVRRICRKDYSAAEPGGAEVWEFRRRCLERGVPGEAIDAVDIDRIEINTGIGKGSASERKSVLGVLNEQLYYRLDQEGQQMLTRDTAAAYAGTRYASRLVPPVAGLRPPVDLQIAGLENDLMALGQPANVIPNQDHMVHVQTHLQRLTEINGKLTEMQIEMEPAINQMFPIWDHANQHMPYLDPENPSVREYKEALEQLGEVIINGKKHIDAEAQRGQEEGAQQSGGDAISPGMLVQAVESQAKLESVGLDLAKKKMELNHMRQKNAQELAFNDARTAADLRNQKLKNRKSA